MSKTRKQNKSPRLSAHESLGASCCGVMFLSLRLICAQTFNVVSFCVELHSRLLAADKTCVRGGAWRATWLSLLHVKQATAAAAAVRLEDIFIN